MPGKVAVIGAGLMGSGIAQVAAQAGYDVVLRDLDTAATDRGVAAIRTSYDRFVAKERLTRDDADASLERITTTTDLEEAGDAEIIIEAVFEQLEAKQAVFKALEQVAREDAVLATNTSAIPITVIASVTTRPDRVVGTHFFSPVPMMALCELVRGLRTSDETLARARTFAESVGKTCIVVNRDVAGFVTTRLICALVMEAVALAETGVASPADIDIACRLGFGHAMGPLATTDLTGVDILRDASMNIYEDTADQKFFPPALLSRMVAAGELGRKSGQGFYRYES